MRDFTLNAYKQYLLAIRSQGIPFYLFRDYMGSGIKPHSFCLIRHDVDRLPDRALNMAKLESDIGIKSTYYFRTKKNTFKPGVIKEIHSLGHEIGYHYESLSDTDGNIRKALNDFRSNLSKLREIVPVKTCAMHGRPLKQYDNRDIWRNKENHDFLINELRMIGEVYLDIDYTEIAYINDTGRNWLSNKSNLRDKVQSNITTDFRSADDLLRFFYDNRHDKLCFQIHPERWCNNRIDWITQKCKDELINLIKSG